MFGVSGRSLVHLRTASENYVVEIDDERVHRYFKRDRRASRMAASPVYFYEELFGSYRGGLVHPGCVADL